MSETPIMDEIDAQIATAKQHGKTPIEIELNRSDRRRLREEVRALPGVTVRQKYAPFQGFGAQIETYRDIPVYVVEDAERVVIISTRAVVCGR